MNNIQLAQNLVKGCGIEVRINNWDLHPLKCGDGYFVCPAIWAVYTHNLPCSMIKDIFTINGTEWQNYIGRCGV
jgi:hypothetical protein